MASISKRSAEEETEEELGRSPKKRIKTDSGDKGEPRKILYYDKERKKGFLLILNFTKDREGTEIDVFNLRKFFDHTLKFEVDDPRQDRIGDLSLSELNAVLEETRNRLNSSPKKYYCFFCAILSHGNENGILCDDDQYKTVDDIMKTFTNDKMSNFVGKPKVFLIQSCRGLGTQQGHVMPDACTADRADMAMAVDWPADIADVTGKISVPTDADVLIAYATTPGNKAWRRKNIGSWFIHVTISVFEELHERDHVEDMFLAIKDEIAKDDEWITDSGGKMMPCTWSTLTQRLMIWPWIEYNGLGLYQT